MAESIRTYRLKYMSNSTGNGGMRSIDVHREEGDNSYKDEFEISRAIRDMADMWGGFQVGDEITIECVGLLG
jgi:hypothetical protein